MFFSLGGGLVIAIGVIILSQDLIIDEKQTGLAEWLLSKPVQRKAYVLAKLCASLVAVLMLLIAAIALDQAERVVFGAGDMMDVPISQAIAASSAIPGFFEPYRIRGRDYVDGDVGYTGHADLAVDAGAKVLVALNPAVPQCLNGDDAPEISDAR